MISKHCLNWLLLVLKSEKMTQDEIIEMAQECNLIGIRPHLDGIYSESLVAFAKLVAAKEREECAQVAFSWNHDITDRAAKEIRDRGEQA